MRRTSIAVGLAVGLLVLAAPLPSSAQSDTTPPQLVSISVSPTQVDVSTSAQTVTVSAVITDDLSGVCGEGDACPSGSTQIQLFSPSGAQQAQTGFFSNVSGDSYTASVTIQQYAEDGVWKDWSLWLYDKTGNYVVWDEWGLVGHGMNIAVGVGTVEASYARTMTLNLSRTKAYGYLDADLESGCFWYVPVVVERKTSTGWKQVRQTLSLYDGYYSVRIRKEGRYRATATEFGLGTPAVTTCLASSARARS